MKTIQLTHLYPEDLCIYGDVGNVLTVKWVLDELGYKVNLNDINVGDALSKTSHWYFIGGGSDKSQYSIEQDLLSKKTQLKKDVAAGVPLLAICGGLQLLGEEFVGGDGESALGLGIFPIVTKAPDAEVSSRSVGNIVIKSEYGKVVGFENHGGQTTATSGEFRPLGEVLTGNGNNKTDSLEGCVVGSAIGCYLHGPVLTKNPELLKHTISQILEQVGEELNEEEYKEVVSVSQVLHESLLSRFA